MRNFGSEELRLLNNKCCDHVRVYVYKEEHITLCALFSLCLGLHVCGLYAVYV